MSLDIFSHAEASRGAQDYAALLDELSSKGFVYVPAGSAQRVIRLNTSSKFAAGARSALVTRCTL